MDNIEIVPFDSEAHFGALAEWLLARNHSVPPKQTIPALGWVLLSDKIPVVTAFLRKVEGGFALIDGLCTNPSVSAKQRNTSIDTIVNFLLNYAETQGFARLMCLSKDENTITRAKRYGFELQQHVVLAKDFKKE